MSRKMNKLAGVRPLQLVEIQLHSSAYLLFLACALTLLHGFAFWLFRGARLPLMGSFCLLLFPDYLEGDRRAACRTCSFPSFISLV